MTSTPTFIATSLTPNRDLGPQRAAVKSWHDAGFTVLSVNAAVELPPLVRDHPDVTFIAATATGQKVARKPVPFIHDLLKALRAAALARGVPLADCVVGLVNDDIHFRLADDHMDEIRRGAQGSLILGARVDVASAEDIGAFTPTGQEKYSVGYDFFFMSGDLLDDFANSLFCIGMPFWDYWLPLMALLKGRPLKALLSPVALHVAHETRWDDTIYVYFHGLIAAVLEACGKSRERNASPESRQFDLLFDVLNHIYDDVFARGTRTPATDGPTPRNVEGLAAFYDRFQEVVVHHIKSRAQLFRLSAFPP